MTKSSFMVAFEGSNIEGEMDVADLAPFLLTMSDVLRRANEVVNDQHAEARVMVRANERGSFLVQLVLDVSIVDQFLGLLDSVKDNPERVVAANQLLDLVIKGGTIALGERWSHFFDQSAASLRWIRVSFRLPNSLVLFFCHRLHPGSIFRGWNAGARCCSKPTISRSRRGSANPFQMR